MDNNLVLANNQAAINAIRATGAKQMILAPGGGWTGGHSWTTGYAGNTPPNSEVMVRLTDPIKNTGTISPIPHMFTSNYHLLHSL